MIASATESCSKNIRIRLLQIKTSLYHAKWNRMESNYTTIEELKSVTTQISGDEWKDFFSLIKKGSYSLYGFHQFLNERPDLCLLIQGIGDYQTAIKATLDEIGLNDGDINGPGGNHLKLIVVDQIGFIVYETKVMNF
nr:MAG TPA: hypothetical protein [Caudoviricetes sp.]